MTFITKSGQLSNLSHRYYVMPMAENNVGKIGWYDEAGNRYRTKEQLDRQERQDNVEKLLKQRV